MICGAAGKSRHDFICADCGDPLAVTMYCERCGRRLALDPDNALDFLAHHGYDIEDPRGLVIKVTCCSACMDDEERTDLPIFRIHLGK